MTGAINVFRMSARLHGRNAQVILFFFFFFFNFILNNAYNTITKRTLLRLLL